MILTLVRTYKTRHPYFKKGTVVSRIRKVEAVWVQQFFQMQVLFSFIFHAVKCNKISVNEKFSCCIYEHDKLWFYFFRCEIKHYIKDLQWCTHFYMLHVIN